MTAMTMNYHVVPIKDQLEEDREEAEQVHNSEPQRQEQRKPSLCFPLTIYQHSASGTAGKIRKTNAENYYYMQQEPPVGRGAPSCATSKLATRKPCERADIFLPSGQEINKIQRL